jgi:hypothetical protein
MRVIEQTVYKFDELNDKAKEKARDWYRENMDFAWADDSLESIKAFCNHFGAKLINYSISVYGPSSCDVDAPASLFRGLKLKDVDRNAMPTGYCLDCSLWFTFYDEFKSTGCANKAFEAALDEGVRQWQKDMQSELEDEHVDECLNCNDYEFTQGGEFFQ